MKAQGNECSCVCCGASVPEGRMVCPICEAKGVGAEKCQEPLPAMTQNDRPRGRKKKS